MHTPTKNTRRLIRPSHPPGHPGAPQPLALWLLVGAVAASGPAAVQATEVSAAAASALRVLSTPLHETHNPSGAAQSPDLSQRESSGRRITVQKGESIDAVIRRGLPGLILNEEFLRQALAKANPRIFPSGRTYPVRPGTVLVLPSPEGLRQQVMLQYPQTAALFQASIKATEGDSAPIGPNKRQWVRFP